MGSGRPFSQRELKFIREHLDEKYPSVIARHLGLHYSEDNGGSRSSKSVAAQMKKLYFSSKTT
jgi:hypothetical protein